MLYYVTIAGRTFEVDLSNGAVKVDGRDVEAELRDIPGTPLRHLLVDGQSWPLVAGETAVRGEWDLHFGNTRFAVAVVDERTRAIREMTGESAESRGPKPMRAPMPGLIVRVEVEPGQRVRRGDGVIIIEAMKMENELNAEVEAVVGRIHVGAGQAVEKGTLLVEFETAPPTTAPARSPA